MSDRARERLAQQGYAAYRTEMQRQSPSHLPWPALSQVKRDAWVCVVEAIIKTSEILHLEPQGSGGEERMLARLRANSWCGSMPQKAVVQVTNKLIHSSLRTKGTLCSEQRLGPWFLPLYLHTQFKGIASSCILVVQGRALSVRLWLRVFPVQRSGVGLAACQRQAHPRALQGLGGVLTDGWESLIDPDRPTTRRP